MTPFWIVDFLEEGSVESFFQAYWDAVQANCPADGMPPKFFYITDGKADGLTREQLNETAFRKLAMDAAGEPKCIPAFTKVQGNSINVIFIGDISRPKTIERLHTWAAYLRAENIRQPWFSINSVRMYAVLIRPDELVIEKDRLGSQVRGFLNELNTLERMDMNHRPFDKVLFVQASSDKTLRPAAEQSACLAAYHIARTDGHCFMAYDEMLYYDCNATGVFFETNVQKEIDAYHLGAIIVKDLADNQEAAFLDIKEAQAFVESNKRFTDSFKPANTKKNFISEAPHLPDRSISSFACKLNLLNILPIWRGYNTAHIDNVVNRVNDALGVFEKDFIRHLNMRQHEFIFGEARELLEYVFQMFCEKNERFKHIGIQQAYAVLEQFRLKITDALKNREAVPDAFLLPVDLDKLYAASQRVDKSSGAISNELRRQVEQLPKYKKEVLASSVISGIALSGLLYAVAALWGLLMLPVALLAGALALLIRVKRIEKLKELFIAARMHEIRKHLDEHAQKLHEKTEAEMKQYMKWVKEQKLARLQAEMHAITPPEFHFRTGRSFQPLLEAAFGNARLVKELPPVQVYSGAINQTVCIYDLLNAHKDTVQALVRDLMFCEEAVTDTEEAGVEFEKHESVIAGNDMLLLLDVSGSMYGDMDALKNYVHKLESVGNIEWIAFSHDVAATSRDTGVDSLAAEGGTNYIPAIRRAAEWLQKDKFDTVVLLSDGGPAEQTDDIISEAMALGMPLNTIAVGAGAAEAVLSAIAAGTGGKEVSVENYEKISTPDVWKNEIMPNIELLAKGEYPFGKLMKHTHIEACAAALRKFALHCIQDYSLSIPLIFNGYINAPGFAQWLETTAQRNTMSPAAAPMPAVANFATADNRDADRMEQRLKEMCQKNNTAMETQRSDKEPDMAVTQLSLCPMTGIGDLQWAASLQPGNTDTCNTQTIRQLISGYGTLVNIYDEKIGQ